MSGAVEGPLPPHVTLLVPGSSGLTSTPPPVPRKSLTTLAPKPNQNSAPSAVADVTLELGVDRIASAMGARLVIAFVELVLYLKGQIPLPPSTLRRMVAGGRKGSPQQTKLLKSLHAVSEDLTSALETIGTQQTVTFALVFGLGRAKCFVQLSGTDFTSDSEEDVQTDHSADENTDLATPSNENANSTPKRHRSSRPPLQEITPSPSPSPSTSPIEDLTSQLSFCTLTPSHSESFIRRAERALAQAMACSDVEFSGNLSPMGAQLYMRAPRGFRHPKWVVRQDAAKTLDGPFESLRSDTGSIVECVRVRANDEPSREEEEEMIWWGWEGRLAGYV